MPHNGWKEYFAFSKKQRNAVFVLLIIIAVVISSSFFYTPIFNNPTIDKDVQAKLNALAKGDEKPTGSTANNNQDSANTHATTYTKYAPAQKEQFYFDPNTLPIDGWKKLGFKDKTIANILRYRDETGKFKKPEDLYNVPRIRKKSVEAILPFVRFGAVYSIKSVQTTVSAALTNPVSNSSKGSYKTIDVNAAIADDFKVFPGMTDPVANRIIKFRNSINGFSSIDDVAKTYGLPDSTFKIMRPYLTITSKQ
jgi:DNA uptake protein ComE-like DNA-binding protein